MSGYKDILLLLRETKKRLCDLQQLWFGHKTNIRNCTKIL